MPGFTLRPMEAADKPAILAIASRTWEGGDYLPFVFDDWLSDAEGEFVAALSDGRIAGCGKLTFLTPIDAWLEGLRKDPDVTEGGLAETVTRHFLRQLAGRSGLRSVRFSTYVFNERSIAVNERLGFRRRGTFSCKARTATRDELGGIACPAADRVQAVRDTAEAIAFVKASGWLEATGGLLCEGWRAHPWSPGLFARRYVDAGRCLAVHDRGRLAGLAAYANDTRYPRTYVKLAFIDAESREAADALFDALLRYVKDHARDENEIEVILPPGARIGTWAAERGFRSWEREDDFLVYEMPLALLAGFAEGGPVP
jgi:RimJ/RimL family protein N-acetyltransferase